MTDSLLWLFSLTFVITATVYALAGFALGSIPFGLIFGRLVFKSDIRASGSGNIGAANALRTYGRGAGVAVLLLDALKGAAAVLLPSFVASLELHRGAPMSSPAILFAETCAPLAGLAAVIGHCYSPWLNFKGGKGVATFLGATLAISPWSALAFVIVWAAVALPTSFASAASLAATIAAGAIVVTLGRGFWWANFAFAFGSALVIFWRHRENIERLRAGTETKTQLLKRK